MIKFNLYQYEIETIERGKIAGLLNGDAKMPQNESECDKMALKMGELIEYHFAYIDIYNSIKYDFAPYTGVFLKTTTIFQKNSMKLKTL